MILDELLMAVSDDGPQVIAPSSRDWDYSFDGGGEWPAAGNALGDNTSGGFVDNTGGDSALSSLITFDGPFAIQFTYTGVTGSAFGVHAINDDDHRTTGQYLGAKAMTNSFSWIDAGTNPKDFFIGATAQSDTNTFAAGSVVLIERDESGNITVKDDDTLVHTFGTTYTGAMRFWIGAGGTPFTMDIDDIFFTDYAKIQRDGFFNEGTGTTLGAGEGATDAFWGTRRPNATRSGTITGVKVNIAAHTTTFNAVCSIYTDDGTNPSSKIGSSSDTVSMDGTGDKTFTFSSNDVIHEKGQNLWVTWQDTDGGSGIIQLKTTAGNDTSWGSGTGATVGAISNTEAVDYAVEIIYDTSAGEPIPDHDTLLLIHSNTTNGSTTFTDSSQFARTITDAGGIVHSTTQAKFGTTGIYFDGTDNLLTVPDSEDWNFAGKNYSIEFWIYPTTATGGIMGNSSSGSWGGINQLIEFSSGKILWQTANGGGTGLTLVGTTVLSTSAWTNVECARVGNTHTIRIAGSVEATNTTDVSADDEAVPWYIGKQHTSGSFFTGYLDEIRISRVARWDADFTPQTIAYP